MADTITTAPPLRIMILDDEATIRTTLSLCLETAGHKVAAFGTSQEAFAGCAGQVFDLLFLDLRLGMENGLDLMPRFLHENPWMKIIVITAYASIDTAVEAMRRGALDYLPKPFTPEHVEAVAGKVAERVATEFRLRELTERIGKDNPPLLVSSSNVKMQAAIDLAKRFAPSKSMVLIQGKDGAGKRTLARLMHEWSPRRDGPYMVCSAHTQEEGGPELQLFGGPAKDSPRRSRLEYCAGGTLYIDDLAAFPERYQLKLLDFIQTATFEREETFERASADVRIIAGATTDVAGLAGGFGFRKDLYFACSSKMVELPRLKERMEDFPKLVEIFLAFFGELHGKPFGAFTSEAMHYLRQYEWPGNLRELRNLVERAVLLGQSAAEGMKLGIETLPSNLGFHETVADIGDLVPLELIEELHIRGVLGRTTSLETAAKILGIDYATLWRRRKKYGL